MFKCDELYEWMFVHSDDTCIFWSSIKIVDMRSKFNQYIEWQWPKYTISCVCVCVRASSCAIRSIKTSEMRIVSAFIILKLRTWIPFAQQKRHTWNIYEVWCSCKCCFSGWFMCVCVFVELNHIRNTHKHSNTHSNTHRVFIFVIIFSYHKIFHKLVNFKPCSLSLLKFNQVYTQHCYFIYAHQLRTIMDAALTNDESSLCWVCVCLCIFKWNKKSTTSSGYSFSHYTFLMDLFCSISLSHASPLVVLAVCHRANWHESNLLEYLLFCL